MRAAASADVTTSPGFAWTPSTVSRSAIAAGVREALLVTNATRIPLARALSMASGAAGTAFGPM